MKFNMSMCERREVSPKGAQLPDCLVDYKDKLIVSGECVILVVPIQIIWLFLYKLSGYSYRNYYEDREQYRESG